MNDPREKKSRHQTTIVVLGIVAPIYWVLGRFGIMSVSNLLISSAVFAVILLLRTISIEKGNAKRD